MMIRIRIRNKDNNKLRIRQNFSKRVFRIICNKILLRKWVRRQGALD